MKNCKSIKDLCKRMAFVFLLFSCLMFTVNAEENPSLEETKAYLKNYCEVRTNQVGKEYRVSYIFSTEQDLELAAQFVMENGLEAFNDAVKARVDELASEEKIHPDVSLRSANPSSVHKTVSGNGNHRVSGRAPGIAHFGSLPGCEYMVELSYTATVSGGKFTNVSNISFDVPVIGASSEWGRLSFPSYCYDTSCGVTANFRITKTVSVPIGNFSFDIKAETSEEVFAVLTSLQ